MQDFICLNNEEITNYSVLRKTRRDSEEELIISDNLFSSGIVDDKFEHHYFSSINRNPRIFSPDRKDSFFNDGQDNNLINEDVVNMRNYGHRFGSKEINNQDVFFQDLGRCDDKYDEEFFNENNDNGQFSSVGANHNYNPNEADKRTDRIITRPDFSIDKKQGERSIQPIRPQNPNQQVMPLIGNSNFGTANPGQLKIIINKNNKTNQLINIANNDKASDTILSNINNSAGQKSCQKSSTKKKKGSNNECYKQVSSPSNEENSIKDGIFLNLANKNQLKK